MVLSALVLAAVPVFPAACPDLSTAAFAVVSLTVGCVTVVYLTGPMTAVRLALLMAALTSAVRLAPKTTGW
jgi:hypothetical protein